MERESIISASEADARMSFNRRIQEIESDYARRIRELDEEACEAEAAREELTAQMRFSHVAIEHLLWNTFSLQQRVEDLVSQKTFLHTLVKKYV